LAGSIFQKIIVSQVTKKCVAFFLKTPYRDHDSPSLDPILNHRTPVNTPTPNFSKTHFSIIFLYTLLFPR